MYKLIRTSTDMGCTALLALLMASSLANGSGVMDITLGDAPQELLLRSGDAYNFSVTVPQQMQSTYSSFVFQVHSDEHKVTLTNTSASCTSTRECVTTGTHVGLVHVLSNPSRAANFSVQYICDKNSSGSSQQQPALIALVGIPKKDPIPGGCSLTSALEIDPGFSVTQKDDFFSINFQSSDIGYDPTQTAQPPCTDQFHFITRLEYTIFLHCLNSPTTNSTFQALRDMFSPSNTAQEIMNLTYTQAKRVRFYPTQQHGVLLNVVAWDKNRTASTSPYTPTVVYNCNYSNGRCELSSPVLTWVSAILLGVLGLFLCFLAHRFFHAEVFLFTFLISLFSVYMALRSTDWVDTDLLVGTTTCLGLALSLLLFVVWFFTNWQLIFFLLFGFSMGFVVTATLLFTPLGSYSLLNVSYIYILILLSGLFFWMLPLVFFSTALNIVTSSLVGSYTIVFSIGLLVHSSVSDIVLRVVRTAAIDGYLSGRSYCRITSTDLILFVLWGVLCILGIIVQSGIHYLRRLAFRKKQARVRQFNRTDSDLEEFTPRRKYDPFPSISLFRQLRRYIWAKSNPQLISATNDSGSERPGRPRSRGDGGRSETRPLLSPSRISSTKRYT